MGAVYPVNKKPKIWQRLLVSALMGVLAACAIVLFSALMGGTAHWHYLEAALSAFIVAFFASSYAVHSEFKPNIKASLLAFFAFLYLFGFLLGIGEAISDSQIDLARRAMHIFILGPSVTLFWGTLFVSWWAVPLIVSAITLFNRFVISRFS